MHKLLSSVAAAGRAATLIGAFLHFSCKLRHCGPRLDQERNALWPKTWAAQCISQCVVHRTPSCCFPICFRLSTRMVNVFLLFSDSIITSFICCNVNFIGIKLKTLYGWFY